jgi:SAM-dependent methyltransferase
MRSILDSVQSKYAAVATSDLSNDNSGVRAVAEAFGYSAEDLISIPAEANMGLSCGNPTATAHLKPGEVVVDLGSGGGLDVFLAAQKVGPGGKAIGIDMTPEMIERAQSNAARGGYTNAEFHQSTIDKLPLADSSVDCVISNCVINLAPDKSAVFREIFRVLKPGGRLAASDIALKADLPQEIANSMAAYVGCIAGAIHIEDYRAKLHEAGFESVAVIDSGRDLNAYAKVENQAACCSPAMDRSASPFPIAESRCCGGGAATGVHSDLKLLLSSYDINQAAASVRVFALKPAAANPKSDAAESLAISERDSELHRA